MAAMARLEFFFDCYSPWTYLAFHRIADLAREAGANLVWRPVLVGGVFNAVNSEVYEQRAKPNPRKARHYVKDLADWARDYGLRIGQPPVFPVNSVKAMRGAVFALERGGFGAPTMFVDGDDMYFGNDRLPLVRRALEARR